MHIEIKRGLKSLVVIILLCWMNDMYATSYPRHRRVLFEHKLDSDIDDEIINLQNYAGKYLPGKGWQSVDLQSMLVATMKNHLPFEGTVELLLTNFNPAYLSDDWVPLSIWSDPGGTFWEVNQTSTSYAFFKTEPKLYNNNTLFWVIWHSPFAFSPIQDSPWNHYANKFYPFAQMSYDPTQTYTFKIVWTPDAIYMVINDHVTRFANQRTRETVEAFYKIFIGNDNTTTYNAMKGPIFSDLKILVPESDVSFTNVSLSTGFDVDQMVGGQGVTVGDLNNDGLDDIMVANCNLVHPRNDLLYIQQSDGTFVEEAALRGISSPGCSRSTVMADLDLDNDIDLFQAITYGSNKLYINQGDGNFINEAALRGISGADSPTTNVLAIDVENDGDLDLYAINSTAAHEMYINQGEGQFVQQDRGTRAPAGTDTNYFVSAIAGDVNGDNAVDIFLTRRNAPCVLFVNDGKGYFANEAVSRGVAVDGKVNSPTFADYDNDGDPDLFISQAGDDNNRSPALLVFENSGNGIFVDKTALVNINGDAFGVSFGDVDNDGYLDLYLLNSNRKIAVNPALLYKNNGNGTFTPLSGTGTEVIYTDGRGSIMSDYNQDGHIDLVGTSYGDYFDNKTQECGRNYLFRNDTQNGNHYLLCEILNENESRIGWGTKIWVYQPGHMGEPGYLLGYREIFPSEGYKSASSLVKHFGVGSYSKCDVRVRLANGEIEEFANTETDRLLKVGIKPPVPTALNVVSKTSFEGTADQLLEDSLVVRVLDDWGTPVQDHPVTFEITEGNGTLDETGLQQIVVSSDKYGLARAQWRLGTTGGMTEKTQAYSTHNNTDLLNSPVEFSAFIKMSSDTVLTKLSGDEQNGARLTPLPDSIKVLVHDGFNNSRANVQVNFQVLTGEGTLGNSDHKTVMSDENGVAAVQWTLGDVHGIRAHSLRASLVQNGESSIVFYASSTFGPPNQILYIRGNNQTGVVGQPLDSAMVVRLLDDMANPCPGYGVEFNIKGELGTINGGQKVKVKTDQQGYAQALLTLGTKAGNENHHVEASFPGVPDVVLFTASAMVDDPNQLLKRKGDNQSAQVETILPDPVSVWVFDQYGNPIPDHPVTFSTESDLLLDGKSSITKKSNSEGFAEISIQLGSTPGTHTIFINSEFNGQPLQGTPVAFTVIARSKPSNMYYVSGDSSVGIINQPVQDPLRVRVTDLSGGSVVNYPVKFFVRRGGGNIDGSLETTVYTDKNGVAMATPTLGNTSGRLNNIFEAQSFGENGNQLNGSPIRFYLSARKSNATQMVIAGGNNQNAQTGKTLSEPLRVKVMDSQSAPVKGHQVLFKVIKGNGKLGNSFLDQVKIVTDMNGIAALNFRLGDQIGDSVHVVQASSDDGLERLAGSPVLFYAHAPYGKVDPARSVVNVPNQVVANGIDPAWVNITLLDSQGNPVPEEKVLILVSGDENQITQPMNASDSDGNISAELKSTHAEQKTVTVRVSTADIILNQKPVIHFLPGPPHKIEIVSGNSQIGTIQNRLANPLIVRVLDMSENPINNIPVYFNPRQGSGEILETLPIHTDSMGYARAVWILGSIVGKQHVDVQVPDISEQATFFAMVELPSEQRIEIVQGQDQFAAPQQIFDDSLVVRVSTPYGSPLIGIPVFFELLRGDAGISPDTALTGLNGLAQTQLKAGKQLGEVVVRARINDNEYVDFSCAIANALPDSMYHFLGNGTTNTVGRVVDAIAVVVVDGSKTPIANVPINFKSLTPKSRVLVDEPVKTNSSGHAFAKVQLGEKVGTYIFSAENSSLKGSPVYFHISAKAENPHDMLIVKGDQQQTMGNNILDDSLQVKIVDKYGNGVPDKVVVFTIESGGGKIIGNQPIQTNSRGIASCQWKLGIQGEQRVLVTSNALPGMKLYFNATLKANQLPVMHVPTDTSVVVDNRLMFKVRVSDPEGSRITLTAENLPEGSSFDPVNTFIFLWTPGSDQIGEYSVKFTAKDEHGGITEKFVFIRVLKPNQAPVIKAWSPLPAVLGSDYGQQWIFTFSATDPDNDALEYGWYINDLKLNHNKDSLKIVTNQSIGFPVDIKGFATDKRDTTSHKWTLQLQSRVKLDLFRGKREKNIVVLDWIAHSETNHYGYNILGSGSKNGTFEKINSNTLLPQKNKTYQYKFKSTKLCYFKLEAISLNGKIQTFGPIKIDIELPKESQLLYNYPNPFNPITKIIFEMARNEKIDISIYNVLGRKVRTLYKDKTIAGYHTIYWDGRNNSQQIVSSGVYYCVIKGETFRDSIKLLLLK